MRHYYYTIYRKDYLYKGLVLYESMERYDKDFTFFVVCMEDESVELLKKLNYSSLVPINISVIEEYDKRIPELKWQRGEKTYVWTAKASVPLYLFDKYPEMDHIIWVDGDTEFLSNPEPIYEQWGNYSVLLTEEKFYGEYEYLGHLVGFYNTGFMGFKRDETGFKVLNYFRDRLQEWKETLEEQSNWNDQLYVDDWTERFENIGVVKHNGINLTPFIASRMNEEENAYVNIKDGIPYIGSTPIVLYHFMALKYYDNDEYDLCFYWMKLDVETINKLYIPYIERCSRIFAKIKEAEPGFYTSLPKRYRYIGNYFNTKVNSEEDKYDICTITDSAGLFKTLALYDSIKKHALDFRMWICCSDGESYDTLSRLKLQDVYIFEPFNLIEYYYRLKDKGYSAAKEIMKARFISLITLVNYGVKHLLYVDNDCYFHQNPKKLFDIIAENSITVIQDNTQGSRAEITSAVMGFERGREALECIFYWVEETKRWLNEGSTIEDELNHISKWTRSYAKINVLKRPCFLMNDKMLGNENIRKIKDQIFVNNDELVLYQHNIPKINFNIYENIRELINKSKVTSKKYIYMPYIKSIKNAFDMLKNINK